MMPIVGQGNEVVLNKIPTIIKCDLQTVRAINLSVFARSEEWKQLPLYRHAVILNV